MSQGESLLITSSFYIDPSQRDEFLQQVQELKAKSQQEEGCLAFELYEDPASANRFFFYHQWRDRAALERHIQTPHLRHWISIFPDFLVDQPNLFIHHLVESKPASLSTFGTSDRSA